MAAYLLYARFDLLCDGPQSFEECCDAFLAGRFEKLLSGHAQAHSEGAHSLCVAHQLIAFIGSRADTSTRAMSAMRRSASPVMSRASKTVGASAAARSVSRTKRVRLSGRQVAVVAGKLCEFAEFRLDSDSSCAAESTA
nr:hypothetical protein [Burkholderia gladioli]